MDIFWTCPICGDECQDTEAQRCERCYRSMHIYHLTDNKCSECREHLGLTPSRAYSEYLAATRQLLLRLH